MKKIAWIVLFSLLIPVLTSCRDSRSTTDAVFTTIIEEQQQIYDDVEHLSEICFLDCSNCSILDGYAKDSKDLADRVEKYKSNSAHKDYLPAFELLSEATSYFASSYKSLVIACEADNPDARSVNRLLADAGFYTGSVKAIKAVRQRQLIRRKNR